MAKIKIPRYEFKIFENLGKVVVKVGQMVDKLLEWTYEWTAKVIEFTWNNTLGRLLDR
jgi:hypothetical protein